MKAEAKFQDWLRNEMITHQMSQSELARRIDVAPSTISRMLHSETEAPTLDTLRRLSTAFGTPLPDLITMTMKPVLDRNGATPPEVRARTTTLVALRNDERLAPGDRAILIGLYKRLTRP